ncbi:hypothetical protein [Streptomyces sp. NPDC060322]|uniref:hypothetical protein n=1 Tax=unclassified Streptomyces TaxID=2593676 RepID=UPI003661C39F
MFTGTAEEYRRRETKAAEYANEIVGLLNQIEELGVGTVLPGRIAGPSFVIRRNGRWSVDI